MKPIISFIKLLIYSNFFVSICVVAFTHLTYIIYNLPQDNLPIVLLMVFSFTFFTYNGQRLFRLRTKLQYLENIGERLQWVIKHQISLTILTVVFGLIGLICTYFINWYCFIILIPIGGLSVFYVIPIIPFYKKSPTLRDLPYLKIFIIALVWSLIIVWIPFVDTRFPLEELTIKILLIALLQIFCFVIAITLPFDVRDMKFDKLDQLKTIPRLAGIKASIILSVIFLLGSIFLLYSSPIPVNNSKFYGFVIGHIITMLIIAFTNENRKELFFAGLVEGTVLILYTCVFIADYFFL